MCETIHIAGSEDKAPAELKGILAEFVLAMSAGFGALSGRRVVAAQKVQHRCLLKIGGAIGLSVLINQQGEGDAGLFAKLARIVAITQPDCSQSRALIAKFLLVLAQLRDMLAAEDSAVMAKEHDYRGPAGPQRA